MLAVVVLSGTALLLRSFAHMVQVPIGFEPRGVLVADLYADTQLPDRIGRLERALASRVEHVPIAMAATMPSGIITSSNFALAPENGEDPPYRWLEIRRVSSAYFSTLRAPLKRGRLLRRDDVQADPVPALVNETFVRKFAGGGDVIGRRVLGRPITSARMIIVGVLADAVGRSVTAPPNEAIYLPLRNDAGGYLSIAVRAPRTPALERALREAVREADPDAALLRIDTLDSMMNAREVRRRFYLTALLVFGALAAILAALGVYAVMAQSVGQQIRELGIRVALGAGPWDIRRLVVGGGARPIIIGLGGGMMAAWWGAGVLNTHVTLRMLLFQVPARDPISISATVILLLGAALLACWIPARRATRVNPVEALRAE
jgi:putative ABC transport system permease protein